MSSESSIARDKAIELRTWFDNGGNGEYVIQNKRPDIVKYWVSDGPIDFRGEFSVEQFIGGLVYLEALQLEETTGYKIDGSELASNIANEFATLEPALRPRPYYTPHWSEC
jgi:hypothetical protein